MAAGGTVADACATGPNPHVRRSAAVGGTAHRCGQRSMLRLRLRPKTTVASGLVQRSPLLLDPALRRHWRLLVPWLPVAARYELAASFWTSKERPRAASTTRARGRAGKPRRAVAGLECVSGAAGA